jgi:hypothetical protein
MNVSSDALLYVGYLSTAKADPAPVVARPVRTRDTLRKVQKLKLCISLSACLILGIKYVRESAGRNVL